MDKTSIPLIMKFLGEHLHIYNNSFQLLKGKKGTCQRFLLTNTKLAM